MTQEIALKILWDNCIHNEETKEAYKVLKERPQDEWICPNCDLYEQAENNYCCYAGKCTIACHRCKYFKQKGGADMRDKKMKAKTNYKGEFENV